MDYFFIENGEIVGCGQAQCLSDGVINVEVTPDMVDYNDNPTWESERFKWKYKWNGEKLIDNPDFEAEEKAHYNEAMRQARSEAYYGETDSLVARKIRKQAIGDWTDEDEAEFVENLTSITNSIKERYPYAE